MSRPRIAQIPDTTIKFSITDSDTTIVLSSLKDSRGSLVAMATAFVPIGFATLAPKGATEEIISFTGITQNTDGSATLTGVTRNLSPVYPYTTLGSGDGHGAGTIVSFSNNPQLYGLFADYIEEIGVSGAPDASVTTKGIVEVATIQEINDDDETGATGAVLSIDPSRLHQSKYGQQLPTADEKAGIAGLSASNKPIQNDSVTSNGIGGTLGEQTVSTNTLAFGRADATGQNNKIAQRFTPTKTKIRGIELWKKANTGTYTGNVTVTLQIDNVGSPSGTPLATATVSSAVFNALADNEAFENLFAAEYTSLVVGGLYWIVIESSTSDNSNHGNVGGRTSGGSGNVKYWNTTDGWVSIANADLYYKVMEGNTNQIVKTNALGIVVNATRVIEYTTPNSETAKGSSTTQYDITNPSGSTFRYTWDGTGTNPNISAATMPIGTGIRIVGYTGMSSNNTGYFYVTGSGTNYFEVENPSGYVGTDDDAIVYVITPYVWTKQTGLKAIFVELYGAGGGGGGGANNTSTTTAGGGGGGGGGAYNFKLFEASVLGATEDVIVGTGGTGGTGGASGGVNFGSSGTSGTFSAFGDFIKAYGGGAGQQGGSSNNQSAGGTGGSYVENGVQGNDTNYYPGGAPVLIPFIFDGSSNVRNLNNIGTGGAGVSSGSGGCSEYGGAGGGNSATGGSSLFAGSGAGGGGSSSNSGYSGGKTGTYTAGTGAAGGTVDTGNAGGNGVNIGDGGAGGGGHSGASQKAGNGGNGAVAGGGGGGGGSRNDGGGGNGGNGGNGLVRITEFY